MSLTVFIPFALVAGSFGLLLAVVWVARMWLRRSDRRSPFTKDMLRGPAHSLRERIDELSQICHQLDTRCRTKVSKPHGRRRSAY